MANPNPIAQAIQAEYPALSPADCEALSKELSKVIRRGMAGGWDLSSLQLNARGGKQNRPLYRLRVRAGLTPAQVAQACCWSISKLNRLEAGEVSASPTDLRFLIGLYQVKDPNDIAEVMKQARRPKT